MHRSEVFMNQSLFVTFCYTSVTGEQKPTLSYPGDKENTDKNGPHFKKKKIIKFTHPYQLPLESNHIIRYKDI